MINFDDMLSTIYNKLKNTKGGKNADYIPELKSKSEIICYFFLYRKWRRI